MIVRYSRVEATMILKAGMISMVFNTGLLLETKCSRAENKSVKGTWTEAFLVLLYVLCLSPFPSISDLVPMVTPSRVVSHPLWTKVPKWSSSLEICKCGISYFRLPNSVSQYIQSRYILMMSFAIIMVDDGSHDKCPWKPGHHPEEAFDAMSGPSLEFLPHFLKQVKLKVSSFHVSREGSLFARKSYSLCDILSSIALERWKSECAVWLEELQANNWNCYKARRRDRGSGSGLASSVDLDFFGGFRWWNSDLLKVYKDCLRKLILTQGRGGTTTFSSCCIWIVLNVWV